MIIGVVGPEANVRFIEGLLKEHVLFAEIKYFGYANFTEAPNIITKQQDKVDAFLFTGRIPYTYAANFTTPLVPWEYLPRNLLSTVTALLQASVSNYKIKNISSDGFDDATIQILYDEFGLAQHKFIIHNLNADIFAPNYMEQVLRFHQDNIKQGKADFCLTGIVHIRKVLEQMGIPVINIQPSYFLVKQKIEALKSQYDFLQKNKNEFCVMEIRPGITCGNQDNRPNSMCEFRLWVKILEDLKLYAEKIGAVLFEEHGVLSLITTKDTMERETHNFTQLDILRAVLYDKGVTSLAVGIGIGSTPFEAKLRAAKARSAAMDKQDFCCYALASDDDYLGPLNLVRTDKKETANNNLLLHIADVSGVSLHTVARIQDIVAEYRLTSTTPPELAAYCKIPLRSLNKAINKLEEAGYVAILGKKSRGKSGRPSRVITINFK